MPEIGREDVRETRVRTYRIVYRVALTQLEILTTFEGHRSFPRVTVASDDSPPKTRRQRRRST